MPKRSPLSAALCCCLRLVGWNLRRNHVRDQQTGGRKETKP